MEYFEFPFGESGDFGRDWSGCGAAGELFDHPAGDGGVEQAGAGRVGILHQARDRGVGLANLAAVLAVLGGFGHAAIAMFCYFALPLAGGDRTHMVAYIERINASAVLGAVVFPLILCFALGILAMAWAAWRAGIIGWWGPAIVTSLVLAHELVPDPPPVVDVVAMVGLTAVFGHLWPSNPAHDRRAVAQPPTTGGTGPGAHLRPHHPTIMDRSSPPTGGRCARCAGGSREEWLRFTRARQRRSA